MRKIIQPVIITLVSAMLAGCATMSCDSVQFVDIVVQDFQGYPVAGAQCQMENSAGRLIGNSPMLRVPVARSGSALIVECHKDGLGTARAVAHSRSSHQAALLLQPFAATAIDHLSGRMYDYPNTIMLMTGKELVWDARQSLPVSERVLPTARLAAVRSDPE